MGEACGQWCLWILLLKMAQVLKTGAAADSSERGMDQLLLKIWFQTGWKLTAMCNLLKASSFVPESSAFKLICFNFGEVWQRNVLHDKLFYQPIPL